MELLKFKLLVNSKKLLLMKLLEIILVSTQSIMLECVHIVYEILWCVQDIKMALVFSWFLLICLKDECDDKTLFLYWEQTGNFKKLNT